MVAGNIFSVVSKRVTEYHYINYPPTNVTAIGFMSNGRGCWEWNIQQRNNLITVGYTYIYALYNAYIDLCGEYNKTLCYFGFIGLNDFLNDVLQNISVTECVHKEKVTSVEHSRWAITYPWYEQD